MISAQRTLRLALIGTVFAGMPMAALGAEAAGADHSAPGVVNSTGDVSEIIVTGAKLGAGSSRATFVLSTEDIRERPFGADITQSLNKVPGLQASTGDARGGSFSFEIFLRGLNKEQIGFTLDGIPTGDARFNGGSPPQRFIDSSNIANVLVSQSAGDIGSPSRFALGGSINFVTAEPDKDFHATIEAGAGSFDFYRGYLRVDTGEIAPGLTAYGSYTHEQNDIFAGRKSRGSNSEHYEFKVSKLWDNGAFLKGRVSFNDLKDNDFNIVSLADFRANPRSDQATDVISGIPAIDVNFGGALGGKRKDLLAYLNAGLPLGEHVKLTVNPYYQTLRGESYRYQDRQRKLAGSDPSAVTGYNATGGAIRPALMTTNTNTVFGGPADIRVTPRDRDRYGVAGEAALVDLVPRNTFRAGAWLEGGVSTEDRNFYPIFDSTKSIAYDRSKLNYVQYARRTRIETTELYAQDSIAVIPDVLRVDAGLTWYNVHYHATSPLEYSAVLDFSQHSKVNPKIAVSFKPQPSLELFGGYAQNFAGIPEDAFLGSTALIAPGELQPVQSRNVDLGARYTIGAMAISVQAYRVHLLNNVGIVPNDQVTGDPLEIQRGNVATRATNILGQTNKGIELTALGRTSIFDWYGSYARQDAHYDNPPIGSVQRNQLASVGIIGGSGVRDIPKNSVYAEVGVRPLDGLRFGATARYVGRRVGGDVTQAVTTKIYREVGIEYIPGHTVFGLGVRYDFPSDSRLKDVVIQGNVDNIFNKAYLGSVSSSTATLADTSTPLDTFDRYFIGAPRTYTLSIRARY